MGDITGRPKAPAPQVVYVPQYVTTPPTTANTQNNTQVNENETPQPSESEQREKSLLTRARSRIGTILTGFRGILAPSESGQRKTLLGE